jgi:hypothetical protein
MDRGSGRGRQNIDMPGAGKKHESLKNEDTLTTFLLREREKRTIVIED